jgi:hypothetical protein
VSRRIARTVALGICLLVAIDAAEARKLLQGGRASGRAGGRGDIKPINGPALPYTTVENPFTLPGDMKFGNVTAIAVNSKGHVFVFHRGPVPLFEFDAKGAFVRAFGEGLTNRPHGLKIDSSDNIWITDSGNHTAVKMDPTGKVLFTLGEQGKKRDVGRSRRHQIARSADRRGLCSQWRFFRLAGSWRCAAHLAVRQERPISQVVGCHPAKY